MEELPARIGPYEVRDRLGHGGMGVVYLGFDPLLDRPVAIKVLKVPDEETRRRFLREARLAARVHHQHIVSIYAVGEHEGNPYLAMEFIAGRTMAQVIRNGDEVPLARKVHWLSELCAGLGHAHRSGIVHRDVKPSNLLIAQSTGTLRLLDFGIAHGNEASAMTMAGMIVGTPQYMSPEQIQGQSVDARSDIFSVGAVAYELLAGRQAFGGDNLYHVSRQIVGEQPRPLESFVPDAPTGLLRAIARCLEKDPAARPESATLLEREFLAIARRLDPEHTLIVRPAEPTVVAPVRDATTTRRELLREAAAAIEQGDLTTASGLLQKLEAGSPGGEVLQLRQKLQARRVELRVHDALTRADEAVQAGTIEDADTALAAFAEIAPRHPELAHLRQALQVRIDARQVAGLTARARQALQQDRLDDAEALVAEALALAPDAADALAVQQKLLDRSRAQRIARLVAQASRALEQEDAAGSRRAIDALLRIDPSHRDVSRLQGRLQALTADIADGHAPETPSRPAPAPLAPIPPPSPGRLAGSKTPALATTGAAAAAGPAAQVREGTRPPSAPPEPVPSAAPLADAVGASAASMRTAGAAAGVAARPADEVLLRRVTRPADQVADDPRPPGPPGATARRWLLPAVVVLLLSVGGAVAYYSALRTPQGVSRPSGSAEPGSPAAGTEPQPVSATDAPAVAITSAGAGTAIDTPALLPAAPRADPWLAARQLVARGAFDRAMKAVDQVQGLPAADVHAERTRIVETARRTTLAARRGAEDLRLTRSPQYVLGTARQAEADRDRSAGRAGSAVESYMAARAHFLQAFTDSGRAPGPGVTAAPVTEPSTTSAGPTQATAAAATASDAPAGERRTNLSTWSNDEARAAISTFCGAYLGRDMGGLGRLWPNMGPEWRAELREAFATSGELVCVFENLLIVRASDEFSASARLLTQLPGGEQRRRSLEISLVPARDRLVIGNIRVR